MKQFRLAPVCVLAGCVASPPPPPLALAPAPISAPGSQDPALARNAVLAGVGAEVAAPSPAYQHLVPTPSGSVTVSGLNVPDVVFFDFGVAAPRPDAAPALDDLARAIQASPPDSVLTVAGNTDAIGSDRINQRLSQDRADAVVAALVGRGIAPSRLAAIGFGATRPIASNDSDAGRARNRRVELALSTSFAANAAMFTALVPVSAQPARGRPAAILARTPTPRDLHANRLDPIEPNKVGPPVSY